MQRLLAAAQPERLWRRVFCGDGNWKLIYQCSGLRTLKIVDEMVFWNWHWCDRHLVGVIYTHWSRLGGLSNQQVIPAVERFIHQTAQNLNVKYPSFDKVFNKFPSYYRRGAIAFAVGQVSSFVTRYQEWQSGTRSRRDAKPPTLNANAGCYPTLYKGQCYKLHGCEQVEIKVFTGTDWIWTTVRLDAQRTSPYQTHSVDLWTQ